MTPTKTVQETLSVNQISMDRDNVWILASASFVKIQTNIVAVEVMASPNVSVLKASSGILRLLNVNNQHSQIVPQMRIVLRPMLVNLMVLEFSGVLTSAHQLTVLPVTSSVVPQMRSVFL